VKTFQVVGISSILLYWTVFVTNIFDNTPPENTSVYDLLKNAVGKHNTSKTDRLLTGIAITAEKLKLVSTHPVISATASDVFFTILSLLSWTFIRDLDVDGLLENSVFLFLAPSKADKHVAFEREHRKAEVEEIESDAASIPSITPKKRGRPKKNVTVNHVGSGTPSSVPSTGTLRRSSRRKTRSDYESDMEETYEASSATKKAVNQTETDGTATAQDLVHSGESTALALFLAFVGGLGQLAAGVLGAEVTGTTEH